MSSSDIIANNLKSSNASDLEFSSGSCVLSLKHSSRSYGLNVEGFGMSLFL